MAPITMFAGILLVFLALILALFVAFRPKYLDIDIKRRRPDGNEQKSLITTLTGYTVAAVEKKIGNKGRGPFSRSVLDTAGVRMSAADFTVLILSGVVVAFLLGFVLAGPVLAVLLAILAPVVARAALGIRADRRRATFDAQLGDTLMTLAGGLRAGHSILRSIDGAGQEAEEPMSGELARIVNETRVGRDLQVSMEDIARRMKSEDFQWVGQAIQINREVGGDLAEVLDHVGETIRERAEIKGHVRALSAEGKFSAYILVALPFAISGMIAVVNPTYIGTLFSHPIGIAMLTFGMIMIAIGSFWMSQMVKIKF